MWFDNIMDDCKEAFKVSNSNKGIFIPIFISYAFILLTIGYFAFLSITIFRRISKAYMTNMNEFKIFLNQLSFLLIIALVTYLLIVIYNSFMRAGSINLYKNAVNGVKLKASHFFDGIKNSFFKIFRGTLFIHIIAIITSPFVIIFILFYSGASGLLSPTWGMIFLTSAFTVFLVAWPIIVVVDNIKPLKAIITSIKLGWNNFLGLFIISLANALIAKYIVMLFGPLVALIAGLFLSGVVNTYFKVVVLIIYKRNRNALGINPLPVEENLTT